MRLLVTNDDGVLAPGIAALATALVGAGHDVVVAAPADDRSGASAAIGGMRADESLQLQRIELEGLAGGECYSVAASPALIVIAACLGGFGDPPDLVVSGINAGANTGRAVLHSGTVGAALTAANFGRSGLAVSLAAGDPPHWSTAAELAMTAVDWVAGEAPCTVVNLNVPNVCLDDVRGVGHGFLAPFGTVRAAIVNGRDGLQMELGADGEASTPGTEGRADAPDGSDTALVLAGWASVTLLTGVGSLECPEAATALERRLPTPSG